MREILCRGKRRDNGEWVYGTPFFGTADSCKIIYALALHPDFVDQGNVFYSEAFSVDPSTVGQYTGLKDKTGKRIFEGDIVQVENPKPFRPYIAVVSYKDLMFVWGVYRLGEFEDKDKLEVIGNIYDNPELLNGGDHAPTN